jgi:hypothetical protein
LSTNGINDANKIYVGQALLLPILMTEEWICQKEILKS